MMHLGKRGQIEIQFRESVAFGGVNGGVGGEQIPQKIV